MSVQLVPDSTLALIPRLFCGNAARLTPLQRHVMGTRHVSNTLYTQNRSIECLAIAGAPVAASASPTQIPSLVQFPPEYYDNDGRLMLKNLTFDELEAWCLSIGEEKQRAMHIWRWMYADRNWIRCFDDAPAATVQNGFSQSFRDKVRDTATIDGGLQLVSLHAASDGTRKLVFKLTAGSTSGQIETVIIPIVREEGLKERVTLCVSSQVGCAQGCKFCYTAKMGLQGNLTPAQVVEQVVFARRLLYEEDVALNNSNGRIHTTPVTNIVYMGMGEPMDNLDTVLSSIHIMVHQLGLHLSANKITVSTVGLVPEMKKLTEETRAVMALSLHAATDEIRDYIVPVNKRHNLKELVGTLEELFPKDKQAPRHGHHVLIEYILLQGINDSVEDASELVELLKNVRCKINLIVFNPHDGSQFQPSSDEAVAAFRDVLIRKGLVATIRKSRGDDQMAACGQLGDPELAKALRQQKKAQSVSSEQQLEV